MRQQFAGHFRLTQDEITGMWKSAVFVFDTNALLNLYRYTDRTRDDLLALIEKLGGRVFIPYQVMREFFNNRYSVITQEATAYRELEQLFTDARSRLKNDLSKYSRHSHIDTVKLSKDVDRAFLELGKQVKRASDEHPDHVSGEDSVFTRLTHILDGKIGARPTPEVRKEAEQWASARMDRMIPPGCADKKKEGDRKLGDALIWKEILDLGRERKQPVIFVTDDVKDDWWLRVLGKTVGPLPELRQEFFDTVEQPFHMYQVEQFMKYAGTELGLQVANTALAEAATVRHRAEKENAADNAAIWHRLIRVLMGPNKTEFLPGLGYAEWLERVPDASHLSHMFTELAGRERYLREKALHSSPEEKRKIMEKLNKLEVEKSLLGRLLRYRVQLYEDQLNDDSHPGGSESSSGSDLE